MIKIILLVLSIICFVLLGVDVTISHLNLLAWGLAFGFASFLPWRE